MTDPATITRIEEFSMNAWPPLGSIHDDGWVLHFGEGYSRRANAIYPLYPGSRALDEKLAACEAMYRAKGQPVIFKLTEASLPAALDQTLSSSGYQTDARTAVHTLNLSAWHSQPDAAVTLSESANEEWLEAFCQMRELSDAHRAIHERITRSIIPERRFASIISDGRIVACGLAVVQSGWVGFYDISTHETVRRQGHGLRVMETLLAWAKSAGAHDAYLQVMVDNFPALALYGKLGFREAYQYWYRIKH